MHVAVHGQTLLGRIQLIVQRPIVVKVLHLTFTMVMLLVVHLVHATIQQLLLKNLEPSTFGWTRLSLTARQQTLVLGQL